MICLTHINQLFDFLFLEVTADFGGQQEASGGHQLPVVLVEAALKDEFLEVRKCHGDGHWLQSTLLTYCVHLLLQTDPNMREREIYCINSSIVVWKVDPLVKS